MRRGGSGAPRHPNDLWLLGEAVVFVPVTCAALLAFAMTAALSARTGLRPQQVAAAVPLGLSEG
jgi:hypothetical protein